MTTIPFIHNYCDRWCEKCRFVHQCAVGVAESSLTEDQKDIEKEAFWNNISDQFKKAKNLLEKHIKQAGIEITDAEIDEAENLKRKKRKQNKENIMAQLSKDYIAHADKIDLTNLFAAHKTDMEQNLSIGVISQEQVVENLHKIKDNADTIEWFKYFIHVKLVRALSSLGDNDTGDLQSDHNGSAKIAILAIESSLGAWHSIYNLTGDENGDILDIMALLSKLSRLTTTIFPDAMQFVRPGFDAGWEAIWEEEE
jgi:hypothetical protein